MDRFKHQHRDFRPTTSVINRNHGRVGRVESGNIPGLRYSSPWPWALALGISLSIWAGILFGLVRLFV
jgi:hypothetical protein